MKSIEIDPKDIESIITFLEGKTSRDTIVNFIKEYIYNPDKRSNK